MNYIRNNYELFMNYYKQLCRVGIGRIIPFYPNGSSVQERIATEPNE